MSKGEDIKKLVDMDAEQRAIDAVIGLSEAKSAELRRLLTVDDFHVPAYRVLWDATCWAIDRGTKGAVTIGGRILDRGQADILGEDGAVVLMDHAMRGAMLNEREVLAVAERVSRKAAARRAYLAAGDAMVALADGQDPDEVAERAIEAMRLTRAPSRMPEGVSTTEDVHRMSLPESGIVIPGLMRREHRVVIVGFEGSGKTWIARQVTELAAQGVHPFFQGREFTPIRTLTVDLENPLESVKDTMERIKPRLSQRADYDPDRAWIWRQPAGFDIRTAKGYGEFTAVLRKAKPDLVAIGPAYHMAKKLRGEDDETYATAVFNLLSDLRTMFGFALLIEHHAPHGDGYNREPRPFGSSAWLRWPEIGIALRPDGPEDSPNSAMKLGRWRGDRVTNHWPQRIVRVAKGYRPWVPDDGRPTIDDEMRAGQ